VPDHICRIDDIDQLANKRGGCAFAEVSEYHLFLGYLLYVEVIHLAIQVALQRICIQVGESS
jgi:hypothetical protein